MKFIVTPDLRGPQPTIKFTDFDLAIQCAELHTCTTGVNHAVYKRELVVYKDNKGEAAYRIEPGANHDKVG